MLNYLEDNISLCWHLPEVFILYLLKGFQVPYGHMLLKIFSVDKEQLYQSYKLLYRGRLQRKQVDCNQVFPSVARQYQTQTLQTVYTSTSESTSHLE